jgi:protein-arginine deiminase
MARLLGAQGLQPPILLDTSWLFVGHVDETLAFVASAAARRGWVALVADPQRARALLQDLAAGGHGEEKLFAGLTDSRGNPAERTVSQVLADPVVTAASATAAARIEAQLAVLRAEVGLAEEEIVRVPVLFTERVAGRLAAYTTNTVNLLAPVPGLVAAPDPHGPLVAGADPFRADLEAALAPHGVSVVWVDTWSYLHVFVGEIHCGTNALRAPAPSSWWSPAP